MKHPIVFLLLLLLAPPAAAAQDAAPPSLQGAIERARDALDAGTPDDAARALLDQATANDRDADRLLAEARALTASIAADTREVTRIERALRADPNDTYRSWHLDVESDAGPAALNARLDALRISAAASNAALAETGATLAELDARPAAIAQALDAARRRIEELQGQASDTASEATPAGIAARAAVRQARAEIAMLEAEQARMPSYRRLLDVRQQQQQRETELQRRQSDVLEALLAEGTDAELDALEQRLVEQAAAVGEGDAITRAEAERNLELGRDLLRIEREQRRTNDALREAQRRQGEVSDSLRNTEARLKLGSADEAVGLILLNQSRRLEDPADVALQLDAARRQLAQSQLRVIDLDEQAAALASPQASANEALQRDDNEEIGLEQTAQRTALVEAFATRAELVERQRIAQRKLSDALVELEKALSQQLDVTRALSDILRRELLWFPSHEPVSTAWAARQIAAWADLFKPSRYVTSMRLVGEAMQQQWMLVALALLLFVVLLRLAHRVPSQLEQLAQPLLRVRTDAYRYTARALVLTLLAAAPWPLLLATVGWLLQHAGQAGKFSDSLGRAFAYAAGALYLYLSLAWLSREHGLGHKHFRWTRARRDALRAAVPWLCAGLLPLQFLLALAFVRGQEPAVDAAARLMLIAACGICGWVGWRVLAPGAVWTSRGSVDIEPVRIRKLLRFAVVAGFATIVVLALTGYVLNAGILLASVWRSAAVLTTAIVLHGLISRWFLLGERHLALKRLELRREAEIEAARAEAAKAGTAASDSTPAASDAGSTPAADPEAELLTLESVNVQTRRLLRALIIVLLLLGLLWVWAPVLPALERLDSVEVWKVSGTNDEGNPIQVPISLGSLLFGLLALALTFIAARNLPGLVELGLHSRTHLDAATRYAFTSVCRYVIVIGGMIFGLSLIGVRWEQLQWLAAALTVGLGFGLQEIFANFVSGLIILFERPFRVGDTITIGEVEGTVTKIRTRATTLLDGDNREVVVPNKMFITSRFVNWTLSDTVTRVVFKLGLAQDSDPVQVRDMLLDLARSTPLVIDNPPPTCWFLQISGGTYDFELRVHVAELLHRNRVRDDLNRRIAEAMKQHDIATGRAGTMNINLLRADADAVQPQG
ncbi:mechanosensitive ion channel domain-containing protein [Chiayiivirga flava]|uniref:Potassium efflux system protein n=1 Tax=Chiayiivirga flava TaxID=659595 RepID=A0A7W8D7I3_9GAMM|nr:mechanosensitive ion channel domain-containing protein [Chiayiivirga flava]MBB5209320.1 potassium efflux system protein [Chiayiivirga flava]